MSATDRVAGRTVLLTGSSSGIGRAIAEQLLDRGAAVIGVAREHAKFDPPGPGYTPVAIDLADLDRAEPALAEIARDHPAIDTVISNAGAGRFGAIEQFSASQVRAGIDLNLTSHLLVARLFLPPLKRRRRGDLVFMGSTAGLRGERSGSVYCAAKSGLRGAAQALADECARSGVRVTLIAPGYVRTPFFDDLEVEPDAAPGSALTAGEIATKVLEVLAAPPGTAFGEVVLRPPAAKIRKKR